MTSRSLGAGVGVDGCAIAAACLLVLTPDILLRKAYRSMPLLLSRA